MNINSKTIIFIFIMIILFYSIVFINFYTTTNYIADDVAAQRLEEKIFIAKNIELLDLQAEDDIINICGNIPKVKYQNGFFEYNTITGNVIVKYDGILDDNCIILK